MTVSSAASYFTNGLDFDAIADGPGRTKYRQWELYNKSKFVCRTQILSVSFLSHFADRLQGNVVVARELARRYGDKIVSTSLHPGRIRTDLWQHYPGWLRALLVRSVITYGGR